MIGTIFNVAFWVITGWLLIAAVGTNISDWLDNRQKAQHQRSMVMVPTSELDALWLASTIRTDGAFEKISMDKRAAKAKDDIKNLVIGDVANRLEQISNDLKTALEKAAK